MNHKLPHVSTQAPQSLPPNAETLDKRGTDFVSLQREQGTTPLRSALGWPPSTRLKLVNLLHTLGVDADVLGIALVAHISSAGSRSF